MIDDIRPETDVPSPRQLRPLTPVTFQILVSLTKETMHGYGLKHDVEERTDGRIRITAGTLYAGLQRMERDGLIRETEPPAGRADEAGTRWRFYAVTALGRGVLEAELRQMEEDLEAARSLLPRPRGA